MREEDTRVSSGPKARSCSHEPLPGGSTFGHTRTPGSAGRASLQPAQPGPVALYQRFRPREGRLHAHTPGTHWGALGSLGDHAALEQTKNRRTTASTTSTARPPGVRGRHLLAAGGDRKAAGDAAPSRDWRTESQLSRTAPPPDPPRVGWAPTLSASGTWGTLPRRCIERIAAAPIGHSTVPPA